MTRKIEHPNFTLLESDIVPVGDTITISAPDATQPHCFAGVRFFSDDTGTPVVPSAGTVAITIETINTEPVFEAIPANVINADAPLTISWAANTKRVRATPAGIVGATHYKLTVTANQT